MSTLTCWLRPVPSRHISAAAKAAAATVACAAVPTANDDGSTGSLPVRLTFCSAASSQPAVRKSAANTFVASGAGMPPP